MTKTIIFISVVLFLQGCAWFDGNCKFENDTERSRVSNMISELASPITGSYSRRIPAGFDGKEFSRFLSETYTDPVNKLVSEKIRKCFDIRARKAGDDYSVMLCNLMGAKVLEDFSCTLDKVDVKYWNAADPHRCEFEADWQSYCE